MKRSLCTSTRAKSLVYYLLEPLSCQMWGIRPDLYYEYEWYNRTGCIDQSQARTTRLGPSIRVHRTGHAAHYILHLIHVLLWLAAFLSRMPLDRRETMDSLRPTGPTCLRPDPTPHCLPLSSEAVPSFWLGSLHCSWLLKYPVRHLPHPTSSRIVSHANR
uniref:Innexin n=1 Tax=Mesocestoides corti TaxID=53468 RepID=A0A5K3G584_MESCO